MNDEETKREKARNMRYKKAIVSEVNIDHIRQTLSDIQEECENIKWFTDTDDETLINALDGNEDEAHEFRMMFADLCAECDQMWIDLQEEYVSTCFDDFFVSIGAAEHCGGMLGWDSYEQDYFGIAYEDFAKEESGKRLLRLQKSELLNAAHQCFKVFIAFYGLQNRYDNLKSSLDILKSQNTGYLQMIKELNTAYENAAKVGFLDWEPMTRYFDKVIENIPQEAWLQ